MVKRLLKIFCLSIGTMFICYQMNAQSMSTDQKIEQVYMVPASSIGAVHYDWLVNILSRCHVITASDVPESAPIQSLNDVALLDKYGAVLNYDETYNPENFNPLKYEINFHLDKDQYFRIGTSNHILRVDKKL